ncbi:MAG TPA: benzoate/H(+) symporter BenE family transporter [Flexivirga sp.]|uniref:benzoate/H(+) symporter BenE family transporter n=1 Tax=Flexivirga sp. TaxID=1962927 RepID=UPI002CC30D24|nr:benzoate/H(+) symporter BenE family transporter [Flexivirga sp.]HWC23088.1 benzoate/H(+) symporter BenE family transporter [Flexivirga sp.]
MLDTLPAQRADNTTPLIAGIVCALVGFTSSFVVVLTGLRAVGASPVQAGSGLLAITMLQGVSAIVLATRYRIPITLAWSTPGAALLAGSGTVDGGWAAATGAFALTGVLVIASGVWSGLAELIARIPTTIAQAMLAGVLLPLCLAPVRAVAIHPWDVLPVIVVWLVLVRVAGRWAVPGAFVAASAVIGVEIARAGTTFTAHRMVPTLAPVVPHLSVQAVLGIALPLFIVTMASQNIPGVAVMRGFGYTVPWRPSMLVTGAATVVAAPAGGHAINLAAISAALAAGPDAGQDTSRRWVAAASSGATYLVLGLASAALTTLVTLAPSGVIETVAGLALLGALTGALKGALGGMGTGAAPAAEMMPAVLTLVVAASGTTISGIESAFWALLVGLVARWWLLRGVTTSGDGRP